MIEESLTVSTPSATRVLIVEDEGLIANDIARRLIQAGYEVAGIAESGHEALLKLKELTPDLILMDIRIKGDMDGVDTAAKINSNFDVPVIFLTAHSDHDTLERAKNTGPFGYLTKPVQPSSLKASIEIALYKHRSEKELRRQKAWLTTILSTMGEAVAVTDGVQSVRFLNPAAEQLTGWKTAEAEGRPLSEVLPLIDPELGVLGDDIFPGLMLEGNTAHLPRGLKAHDRAGVVFDIEGEIAPSLDHQEMLGAVVTFRDATKRQEEERQIRYENKMQAIGRLAAGVAHQFNNTLGSILGQARMVSEQRGIGSAVGASMEKIMELTESAAAVTRQLLTLNQHTVSSGTSDMNMVVEDARDSYSQAIGPPIVWKTQLENALKPVNADFSPMARVLALLVENARESMPGGGQLTLKTENVELPLKDAPPGMTQSYVAITVEDTGTGMEQDVADQIFEPFFTTKTSGTGKGLGLAVVRSIVRDFSGTIGVHSEPGKGSAFTVYLPATGLVEDAQVQGGVRR